MKATRLVLAFVRVVIQGKNIFQKPVKTGWGTGCERNLVEVKASSTSSVWILLQSPLTAKSPLYVFLYLLMTVEKTAAGKLVKCVLTLVVSKLLANKTFATHG